MTKRDCCVLVSVATFILLPAFPGTAHAYLNPGSGSFIFQVVVATLLGGLLTIRIYWARIKAFFVNLFLPGRKK